MARQEVHVRVSVAWWLRWYIFGVIVMCRVTGSVPDPERVAYWCMRSVRVRVR